ncbi:MAG: ATP-binding cassette domain-containing protein, partial [Campylobacteraceae bacterium]|nr:ATP-binding cassette domain-containing protein [Campylobacteraceae bacterium]
SGKTMLLEALAGIQKIEGSISCDGVDVTDFLPEKRNFGFVYQDVVLFQNMSVEKNIKYSLKYKKIEGEDELFDDLVGFLKIGHILKRDTKHLSGGEKQRVAIARAIYSRPKLLLLDEPSMGLAPIVVEEIFRAIKELRDGGTTIFIVEQNAFLALSTTDRAYVLENGKIVMSGNSNELLRDERVKEAYLGA